MKKNILLVILIASSFLFSCDADDQINIDSHENLFGYWKYEYELRGDGSKDFSNPYALLEFTYSDGFILEENYTGSSVWFDNINEDFKWEFREGKLILTVKYDDGTSKEFIHSLSEIKENSLIFNSQKGHTYYMRKSELPKN